MKRKTRRNNKTMKFLGLDLMAGMMLLGASSTGQASALTGDEIAKGAHVQTTPVTDDAREIITSLQEKGTPAKNYKISEAEPDIILDAEAFSIGPND